MQPTYTALDAGFLKKKHQVLGDIVDVIFAHLEAGDIDDEEAREIASYILERVATAQLITDFQRLLHDLAGEWDMFMDIANREEAAMKQEAANTQKLEEDKSRIESLKKQLVDLSQHA